MVIDGNGFFSTLTNVFVVFDIDPMQYEPQPMDF